MNHKDTFLPRKISPLKPRTMLQTIYGCKWSLTIYTLIAHGINQPKEMINSVEGLTSLALNSCLKLNLRLGILQITYGEAALTPKSYTFTSFGTKFLQVVDSIDNLQTEIDHVQHFSLEKHSV